MRSMIPYDDIWIYNAKYGFTCQYIIFFILRSMIASVDLWFILSHITPYVNIWTNSAHNYFTFQHTAYIVRYGFIC